MFHLEVFGGTEKQIYIHTEGGETLGITVKVVLHCFVETASGASAVDK